jgi:acyl-CoA synthetase (AMP-forming)/AMP-acid ligase II
MAAPGIPSYPAIEAALCGPGQSFEMETVEVLGRPARVWKHAPRCLGDALAQGRAAGGARDFIVLGDERLSHERHFGRAAALATALVEDLGVTKGDRVAIAMRNIPEWSIAFFATTMAGAIAVPLNAFWNGPELAFAVADCEPKVVVADGERLERMGAHAGELAGAALVGARLDERKGAAPLPGGIVAFDALAEDEGAEPPPVEVAPDDFATIFYTSGTTGSPKGVLGTHRNICTNLLSLMYAGARTALRSGLRPGEGPRPVTVLLVPVPLFHATGCHSILVAQAFFGGTLVFMRRWDPEAALDLIERERVTAMSGVPAMVWDLVNSPTLAQRDLASLKSLGGGGAAAPPELLRRARRLLPASGMGTGYGLTETSSTTTSIGGPDWDERPGSVGVPVPVCDVRVVDDDGHDVAAGEPGEVWIKGPNVVPGYWRRPDETATTFTEGWLHSGDVGRVDAEGFLYIVDRAKDIVIRGGENISSLEVEAALYEHPAVQEAAVFSVPHETLGEEVGAVVHVASGTTVTAEQLRAHAATVLAPFKVPAHVWLVTEALPRSPSGKLLKRELRQRFALSDDPVMEPS